MKFRRLLSLLLPLLLSGCQLMSGVTIGLNYGSGEKTMGVTIKLPEYRSGKNVAPTGKETVPTSTTPTPTTP